MRVLDLFSGIGGFSLGLERTGGFTTHLFCENNDYCRKILRDHWPSTFIWPDVTTITDTILQLGSHDVICGGFPCQDISVAKPKGKGIEGSKSGLWRYFRDAIEKVRPHYAIIENVANLRLKGLTRILKDLWSLGYDAEWKIISAAQVGAPHRRERCWIVAYPQQKGLQGQWLPCGSEEEVSQPLCLYGDPPTSNYWTETKPPLPGMDDGVPHGVDRVKITGNTLVPQIVQWIGERILEHASKTKRRSQKRDEE